MGENAIKVKSYNFALRVIKLSQFLREKKREYILSKQVLRSGTSIGANVEEALGGCSTADFIYKLQIALKEGRESHYWLRLLIDSGYFNKEKGNSILTDCDELLKLLNSILITTKRNEELKN